VAERAEASRPGTGSSQGLGLVVADPGRTPGALARSRDQGDSVLSWGTAIAPAVIESRQLVLVGGYGKVTRRGGGRRRHSGPEPMGARRRAR
jgi:hypothetical protein